MMEMPVETFVERLSGMLKEQIGYKQTRLADVHKNTVVYRMTEGEIVAYENVLEMIDEIINDNLED